MRLSGFCVCGLCMPTCCATVECSVPSRVMVDLDAGLKAGR